MYIHRDTRRSWPPFVWISFSFIFISISAFSQQKIPDALKNIQITEHLGRNVPIHEFEFSDEEGKLVQFKQFFTQGKPVVLNLGYYRCGTLCNYSYQGLSHVLKNTTLQAGRDFEVVSISIDPKDDFHSAAEKKATFGWHFLTGKEDQVKKLAEQVGFGYRYIPEEKQFAHGAASFVLTSEGKISRYLYGIEFDPKDFKLALVEASNGRVGTLVDRILLFCYHYDPGTRKYSLYSTRLMSAGGASTLVIFGGYLVVFWNKQRRLKAGSSHV